MHVRDILGFYSDESDFDTSGYIPHSLWKLDDKSVIDINSTDRYLDSDVYTEDVIFSFKLKRLPLYFMMNNIFPSLILNCVTLLAYSLPFATQIGLSMTTFMTFSVYSVRISGDMPVESNFLPMVTIYFILGITYAFVSMIWFIIANDFITKNKMPKVLIFFASIIKRILFWKFDENQKIKILPKPKILNKADVKADDKNILDEKMVQKKNQPELKSICHNCDHCTNCKLDKEKEKDKKKKKDVIESNVSALNHFMCFTMFLTVLTCNMFTWLIISHPSNNF